VLKQTAISAAVSLAVAAAYFHLIGPMVSGAMAPKTPAAGG
jgi:hypothetical protein